MSIASMLAAGLLAAAPLYPGAQFEPAHVDNTQAPGDGLERVEIRSGEGHVWSLAGWYSVASAGQSAHFVVSHTGEIVQCVDMETGAIAEGAEPSTVVIELEGFAGEPGWRTEDQHRAAAMLLRWLDLEHGIADVAGDLGPAWAWPIAHGMAEGLATAGEFRLAAVLDVQHGETLATATICQGLALDGSDPGPCCEVAEGETIAFARAVQVGPMVSLLGPLSRCGWGDVDGWIAAEDIELDPVAPLAGVSVTIDGGPVVELGADGLADLRGFDDGAHEVTATGPGLLELVIEIGPAPAPLAFGVVGWPDYRAMVTLSMSPVPSGDGDGDPGSDTGDTGDGGESEGSGGEDTGDGGEASDGDTGEAEDTSGDPWTGGRQFEAEVSCSIGGRGPAPLAPLGLLMLLVLARRRR